MHKAVRVVVILETLPSLFLSLLPSTFVKDARVPSLGRISSLSLLVALLMVEVLLLLYRAFISNSLPLLLNI